MDFPQTPVDIVAGTPRSYEPRSSRTWDRVASKFTKSPFRNSVERKVSNSSYTCPILLVQRGDSIKTNSSVRSKTLSRSKSCVNDTCAICEDKLNIRQQGEKIVTLKCAHLVHEECLKLYIGKTEDGSIFPKCDKCEEPAVPVDKALEDMFIAKHLLKPRERLIVPVTSPILPSAATLGGGQPVVCRNVKDLTISVPKRHQSFLHYEKLPSRGSIISAQSSVVSSATSRSPLPFNSSIESKIPLALNRSKYISGLIQSSMLDDQEIDSVGLLRVVDKLMVGETQHTYIEKVVYLFEQGIVIQGIPACNNNYVLYKFTTPKVTAVDVHTLHINFTVEDSNEVGNVYLSDKDTRLIEKWRKALQDPSYIFGNQEITYTLQQEKPVQTASPIPEAVPVKTSKQFTLVINHEGDLSHETMMVKNCVRALNTKCKSLALVLAQRDNVYAHGFDCIVSIGNAQPGEPLTQVISNYTSPETTIIYARDFEGIELSFPNVIDLQIGAKLSYADVDSWSLLLQGICNKTGISFEDESDEEDSDYEDTSPLSLHSHNTCSPDIRSNISSTYTTGLPLPIHPTDNMHWSTLFEDVEKALSETINVFNKAEFGYS